MRSLFVLACLSGAFVVATGCGGGESGGSGGASSATSSDTSTTSSTGGGPTTPGGTGGNGCVCLGCETVAEVEVGSFPYDVKVDDSNIYWTNRDSGQVMKASKDDGSNMVELASGRTKPWGLTVDKSNVYWAEYFEEGVPQKVPIDGGTVEAIQPSQGAFPARHIIVDDNFIWYSTEPDDIWRCDLDGLNCYLMLSANILSNVVVKDESFVYWVNRGLTPNVGEVKKSNYDGTGETFLASAQAQAWGIPLDDTYVYWTSFDDGKVQRADKTDGNNVVELFVDEPGVSGIVVDSKNVYWANEKAGTIHKVPKDGGTETVIADCQGKPANLVVDGTFVYWAASDDQMIMKAPK